MEAFAFFLSAWHTRLEFKEKISLKFCDALEGVVGPVDYNTDFMTIPQHDILVAIDNEVKKASEMMMSPEIAFAMYLAFFKMVR
jgi:hypothetical protein